MQRTAKDGDIEMSRAHSVMEDSISGYTHEEDLFTTAKLREVLKPLITSMRFLGIINADLFQTSHMRNVTSTSVHPSFPNGRGVTLKNTPPNPIELSNGKSDTRYMDMDKNTQNVFEEKQEKLNHSVNISISSSLEPSASGFEAVKRGPTRSKCIKKALAFYLSVLVIVSGVSWMVYSFYTSLKAESVIKAMSRVVILLWFSLSTFQAVICLLVTSYRCKFRQYQTRFEKFVQAINEVQMKDISRLKKYIRNLIVIAWSLVITNTAIVISAFWYPDLEVRKGSRAIFFGESELANNRTDTLAGIYTISHYFTSGCWAIPTSFYISLCTVVVACFDDLFDRASAAILHKTRMSIVEIRQEYVRLCHLLTALNDLLSPLGMFIFAIYIPLICLNINICIQTFGTDSVINRVGYVFWIISNVGLLLVTSVAGAQVNNAACRLSEAIYDIDVSELDQQNELELMLLLSNVTSNSNGVTVGGLVTITKEMIITVFGTILGYLTILIQFK